ncbi:MAG: topoisomerase DNA-binding C4 zinc finger domain-containing protein [Oscillospiraceae bacterium]|nr:topoisomerase DNA-binding C4 zinc finger domain-containing protein [Oscillospiraceae bacterium]
MQNKTHIKHLKAMLGETIPMHSIITFSDRCTLKNVQVKSTDIHVINRNEVVGVVATIASRQPDLLTTAQIQEIHDLLYPYTQTDDAVKQKHIERIEQAIHSDPEEPTVTAAPISPLQQTPSEVPTLQETSTEVPTTQEISTEVPDILPEPKTTPLHCPKCGAELVLRTAKKGSNAGNQFYGCSNFPKCRYIRSV